MNSLGAPTVCYTSAIILISINFDDCAFSSTRCMALQLQKAVTPFGSMSILLLWAGMFILCHKQKDEMAWN